LALIERSETLHPEPDLYRARDVIFALRTREFEDAFTALGIISEAATGEYVTEYESVLRKLGHLTAERLLAPESRAAIKRIYECDAAQPHRALLRESAGLANDFLHQAPESVLVQDRIGDDDRSHWQPVEAVAIRLEHGLEGLTALTADGNPIKVSWSEVYCNINRLTSGMQTAIRAEFPYPDA
jgi:hypothetical protein